MRTALVQRARHGDEDAFTELVDLDGDRCYAIAYRILRDVDRAKDAVQQAFLLAWRELPRLRDPERFEVSPSSASSLTTTRPAGSSLSWRTPDRSGRGAWKPRLPPMLRHWPKASGQTPTSTPPLQWQ